jgi:ATP synthase protein I
LTIFTPKIKLRQLSIARRCPALHEPEEAAMAPGKLPENPAPPVAGDEKSLASRSARLGAVLAEKEAEERKDRDAAGRRRESAGGMAYAVKMSSEFIAGIVVGAVIGWMIDKFAGTTPWGLIIFLLLGFCAGVLNILRTAGLIAVPKSERGIDLKPPAKNAAPKGNAWADDEED